MINKTALALFISVFSAPLASAGSLRKSNEDHRNLGVASLECTLMVSSDARVEGAWEGAIEDETIECEMDAADMNGTPGQIIPVRGSSAQLNKFKTMLHNGELIPGESTLMHQGAAFSEDGLFVPPGLDVASAVRKNGNTGNTGRRLQSSGVTGDKPILVVKVTDVNGKARSESPSQIGDDIFGTNGDSVNLKSQMSACSFGQLNIIPGEIPDAANNEAAPGVIEVTIPIALDGGGDRYAIHNAVTAEVQNKLGITLPGPYHQVMYVLEACYTGCGWAAYAYINSWMSVYQAQYFYQVGVQMHEIGHNFGLAHSGGLDGATYTDHTCLMGNPLYSDDIGKMCYNGAKNWQLGWYNSNELIVNPVTEPSKTVTMVGIANFDSSLDRPVVVKVETGTAVDFFIAFNRAIGVNSQNDEADNEVTIVESGNNGDSYSQSFLKATLIQGESYTISNFGGVVGQSVTITAETINLSTNPGEAVVNICLGSCTTPAPVPATPAPTKSPSKSPSKSPTPAPVPPTQNPTKSPSKSPSKSPTSAPVPPTPAPTKSPSKSPSKSPTPAPVPPTPAPTKSPFIFDICTLYIRGGSCKKAGCTWNGTCSSGSNPPPSPSPPTTPPPSPTGSPPTGGNECNIITRSKTCRQTSGCTWSGGLCV